MMNIVGVAGSILACFGVTWFASWNLDMSYSDHFVEFLNEKKPYIHIPKSQLTDFKAKALEDHGYVYYAKEEGPFGGDFLAVYYYKFTGNAAKAKDK